VRFLLAAFNKCSSL